MFVTYRPEGTLEDSEVQRWKWDPNKVRVSEAEIMERKAGVSFVEFSAKILQGDAHCRRVLLWALTKRRHPSVKFEDIDFAWDELKIEYSKSEYKLMLEQIKETLTGTELEAATIKLTAEMMAAYDDEDDEGKAHLPIAE